MGVKDKSNLLVSGKDGEMFLLQITSSCKTCNWEVFHLCWKSLIFPVMVCGNKSNLQLDHKKHKGPLYFLWNLFRQQNGSHFIMCSINFTFTNFTSKQIIAYGISSFGLFFSPTPAGQTLMPCLWSEGSCSSLSRATFGGSGMGIWKAVTQRWRPVTGGGFPTTSMLPLKIRQGIFGSFKVSSKVVWAAIKWFKVLCKHRIRER